MRFQALLLSLVILVSLLLSEVNKPSGESPEAKVEPALASQELKLDNPFSIFLEDFYSVLSEKMNPVRNFISNGVNLVGQGLALAAANLNQNLAATKEIFKSDTSYESYPSTPALVSGTRINTPDASLIFPCQPSNSTKLSLLGQPDQSGFTGFTGKAILMKYLNPSTDLGQVIFELNPEKRWPIASLTKLMTAVLAIEKMDLNKEAVMSEKAVTTEGTAGEFQNGEVFRFQDLIKAMLISSSNDAAVAIAETFGERDFINEMQKKAAGLKMFSTTYLEPTGLSFINQSTVSDLAKLMNYIYLSHPEILEISRQKEAEILELRLNKPRKLLTINKFAGKPDFIGGKTGYIDEAGRNLIGLFDINGKTVLIITLGAEDSFKETEKLKGLVKNCQ
jgi:hypothetical protein